MLIRWATRPQLYHQLHPSALEWPTGNYWYWLSCNSGRTNYQWFWVHLRVLSLKNFDIGMTETKSVIFFTIIQRTSIVLHRDRVITKCWITQDLTPILVKNLLVILDQLLSVDVIHIFCNLLLEKESRWSKNHMKQHRHVISAKVWQVIKSLTQVEHYKNSIYLSIICILSPMSLARYIDTR